MGLAVISHTISTVQSVLAQFQQNGIGPHYIITRQGTLIQLVDEHDRAWHAGLAFSGLIGGETKDGTNDVNSHSIGISLEGNGCEMAFMDIQYTVLSWLLK